MKTLLLMLALAATLAACGQRSEPSQTNNAPSTNPGKLDNQLSNK